MNLKTLCDRADEFYDRGDAFGGSGNLSVRSGDSVWITPTGYQLKGLKPEVLANVRLDGSVIGSHQPSKEVPFHLAIYRARPDVTGIVHLHAPYSVAVSCLADLSEPEPIPALTPYFLMRVAPLGVVEYYRPGSAELADAIERKAESVDCMLLRNHGLVCTGSTFDEAADRAIELEETCKLHIMLRGSRTRVLSEEERHELRAAFPSR